MKEWVFNEIDKLKTMGVHHFRIDFTLESSKEVANVLCLYHEGKGRTIDYTNGHYKRGVE